MLDAQPPAKVGHHQLNASALQKLRGVWCTGAKGLEVCQQSTCARVCVLLTAQPLAQVMTSSLLAPSGKEVMHGKWGGWVGGWGARRNGASACAKRQVG